MLNIRAHSGGKFIIRLNSVRNRSVLHGYRWSHRLSVTLEALEVGVNSVFCEGLVSGRLEVSSLGTVCE